MNRSPLEIDHVKEFEELAAFGGTLLLQDVMGRLKLVGGTEDDRARAKEWVNMFLGRHQEVRWRR